MSWARLRDGDGPASDARSGAPGGPGAPGGRRPLYGPAAPVLEGLFAAQGLTAGEWWPFLVQEEGKVLPGGVEALSGFVLTRGGEVFGWWLDWAPEGRYVLDRWWRVGAPEREFAGDAEFRRARRRGFYTTSNNRFTGVTEDGKRITTHFRPESGEHYVRGLWESTYR